MKLKKSIWQSPWRFIGLFFGSMVVYGFLNYYGGYFATLHGSLFWLVTITLLTIVLSISMLMYMLKEQRKYSMIEYSRKHRSFLILKGLLAMIGALFITVLIMVFCHFILHLHIPLLSLNEEAIMSSLRTKIGRIYIGIMLIFAPTIEEFFCRFMIVGPNPIGTHHVNKWVYGLRIFISITFFSLMHVAEQFFVMGSIIGTLIDDLPYLADAVIFTYFYVRTQDIKVPIAIHTIWDVSLFILHFVL